MANNVVTEQEEAEFQQAIKDNESKNFGHIKEFEAWLKDSGLAPKTVDKHCGNVEFFLNWYLMREDIILMEDGMDTVEHFISTYLAREEYESLSSIKGYLTSVKKFYQCMAERGHVEQQRYAELLDEIKQNKKYWYEESQGYLDELPPKTSALGISDMMSSPLFSDIGSSFMDMLLDMMDMPANDDILGGYAPEDDYDEEAEVDEETLQRLRDEVLDQLIVAALYVMSFKDRGKSGENVRLARKEVISQALGTCVDVEGYLGHDSPKDEWVHITDQGVSAAKSVLLDLGYPELARDEQ